MWGDKYGSFVLVSVFAAHNSDGDEFYHVSVAEIISLPSTYGLDIHTNLQVCHADGFNLKSRFPDLFIESTDCKSPCRRFRSIRIRCRTEQIKLVLQGVEWQLSVKPITTQVRVAACVGSDKTCKHTLHDAMVGQFGHLTMN